MFDLITSSGQSSSCLLIGLLCPCLPLIGCQKPRSSPLGIGQCKCQLLPSLISLIASSEVTTISEERELLTGGEGYLTNQQNTIQPTLRLEFNSKRRKHRSIKRSIL